MQIIQHRVNTISQLKATPIQYGVELDIRDKYEELIIQHDAFTSGESWDEYIKEYKNGLMIANVKTEGIEEKIIADLTKNNIDNYFLLDVSLPFLVKLSNKGIKKMAVRFSEVEPIELATKFINKVDWLWVDCFTHLPLHQDNFTFLKKHFKICVVSPELQGHAIEMINTFKTQLANLPIDAVCTKFPNMWE